MTELATKRCVSKHRRDSPEMMNCWFIEWARRCTRLAFFDLVDNCRCPNVVRDFTDRGHLNWEHVRQIRKQWSGASIIELTN